LEEEIAEIARRECRFRWLYRLAD